MTGFRDVTFDPKGVDAIIKTNIKRNFDGVTYDSSKNEERTSALVNDCVKGLQSLNIPFKFAVNAIVVQNVSAGLATSAGFYWDSAKDGTSCVVPSLSYSPFVSFVHTISLADIYVGILSIVCVRQDSQRPNGRTSTTRLLSPFLPWASNHTRIRFGDEWGGGSNRCVANEQTSKPENFRPKKKFFPRRTDRLTYLTQHFTHDPASSTLLTVQRPSRIRLALAKQPYSPFCNYPQGAPRYSPF